MDYSRSVSNGAELRGQPNLSSDENGGSHFAALAATGFCHNPKLIGENGGHIDKS